MVTGVISFTVLISVLLLINLTQCLSLVLKLIPGQAFRKYNRACAGFIWTGFVYAVGFVQGVPVIFTGDKLPTDENAVIIANHQELSDVLFMLIFAHHYGRLADLKWFGKDALKYVPAVGWGLRFIDCVFLKRDWMRDQRSIEATFANLYENRVPMWLVNFMEGTRQAPEKYAASRAYAEKNGLRPLENLLLPRPKGFVATVHGLKDHLDAVYDLTLGYEGGGLSLKEIVFGPIRPVHIHVRRFSAASLPKKDDELTAWVRNLFQEKDQLLNGFKLHSKFPERTTLTI